MQDEDEDRYDFEPWDRMRRAIAICLIIWAITLLVLFSTSCSVSLHSDGTESFDFNAINAIQAVEELNHIQNQK